MHSRNFLTHSPRAALNPVHPHDAAKLPWITSVLGASTKDGHGEPVRVTHLRRAPDQPSLGDSPAAAITPLLLHNAFLRGQGWLPRLANAQPGPRGTEGDRGTVPAARRSQRCPHPAPATGARGDARRPPRVGGIAAPSPGGGVLVPKVEEAVMLRVPATACLWDSLPLAEPRGCSTPIARDKARGSTLRAGTGSAPGRGGGGGGFGEQSVGTSGQGDAAAQLHRRGTEP